MSGPAVVIGFILLIPSSIGMLSSVVVLLDVIAVTLTDSRVPNRALLGLIGSSWAFAIFIVSFVSGLLGWLLVMKKRVLQCDLCGAVVNAS
jgi:hypothetical protein